MCISFVPILYNNIYRKQFTIAVTEFVICGVPIMNPEHAKACLDLIAIACLNLIAIAGLVDDGKRVAID